MKNTMEELCSKVTAQVIKALESGDLGVWRKPWMECRAATNFCTGNEYLGFVNQWLLRSETISKDYEYPFFAGFGQIKQLGGSVKAGEHGITIVYASISEKDVEVDGEKEKRTVKFFGKKTVFNLAQTTGLDTEAIAEHINGRRLFKFAELEELEAFFAGVPARVEHRGDRAFYRPSEDLICLPKPDLFDSAAAYYAVRLHESIHWTGHASRLNRLEPAMRFGSEAYAFEELVAEIGTMIGCENFTLNPEIAHENYIAGWLSLLRNDHRSIFKAASLGQSAFQYLLSSAERGARPGQLRAG